MQRNVCTCNLALSSYHACQSCMPKRLFIEIKIYDNYTPEVNMACVGVCASDCMPFTARLNKVMKIKFIIVFVCIMFLNNCSCTNKTFEYYSAFRKDRSLRIRQTCTLQYIK